MLKAPTDPVLQLRLTPPSKIGVESSPGALPTIGGKAASLLERQVNVEDAAASQAGATPLMTSSSGYYFTTHRVTTPQRNGYPYIAAGKLYFHDPRTGGDFVCTASVIRARLLSTAGHCVTHPSTSASSRYFYSKFLFVPGLDATTQPYGQWGWSYAIVANTWYFSNGSVPNAQDVALIEVADKGATKISAYTGYLGFATGGLAPNHLTALGYPCNLDSCTRMQRSDAQSFTGSNNTAVVGSAMRGGASGGPWIQDFGVKPTSNPAISGLGANYQRANTSYGPTATEPKYLGASIWDSRWVSIKNSACAHKAGNC
jgi:V8-like Glu-specific endopeptidase